MGGCTNCGGKAGCDDRKGGMFAALDDTLARLYPDKVWGAPVAAAAGSGLDGDDLDALADELAAELDTVAFVHPGDDDEPCDYVYVLATGGRVRWRARPRGAGAGGVGPRHRPGAGPRAVPAPHHQPARPDGGGAAGRLRGRGTADGLVIRERPRAGVYDAPLLSRMQRLVAILPAYGLTHLDFGEISAPARRSSTAASRPPQLPVLAATDDDGDHRVDPR
ncbi:MAG: hypothetical protein R2939_12500 [Kofleriaceae bacterium]